MARIHFLNVLEGDCSIIEHNSGRTTVIDVCNAKRSGALKIEDSIWGRLAANALAAPKPQGLAGLGAIHFQPQPPTPSLESLFLRMLSEDKANFCQKDNPVNPIEYMKKHKIEDVHRFVLTHPDMDHMDGIRYFFETFRPMNFWDTANTKPKPEFKGGKYDEKDWDFYQGMRDNNPQDDPKRLVLYSGSEGRFYNQSDKPNSAGDGLHVLAPTKSLIRQANAEGDFNPSSYVLLYRTANRKILFGGDSDDDTWEHLTKNHKADVENVDLLIAPHHGRRSGMSTEHLRIVNPKLTLFGNANSKHLNYEAWTRLQCYKYTNNEANCVVVEVSDDSSMNVYVTNEEFARQENRETFYSPDHKSWYTGYIT